MIDNTDNTENKDTAQNTQCEEIDIIKLIETAKIELACDSSHIAARDAVAALVDRLKTMLGVEGLFIAGLVSDGMIMMTSSHMLTKTPLSHLSTLSKGLELARDEINRQAMRRVLGNILGRDPIEASDIECREKEQRENMEHMMSGAAELMKRFKVIANPDDKPETIN
jgi:hypothetical protein